MDALLDNMIILRNDSSFDTETTDDKISVWVKEGDKIRPNVDIEIINKLKPAIYKTNYSREIGSYCYLADIDMDLLYEFSDSCITEVLEEVNKFWGLKDVYKKNSLIHKRGILLEGSPGCGKSSLAYIIAKEAMNVNGIAFLLDSPQQLPVYVDFIKNIFRIIEPDTPVITIIEDLDYYHDESEVYLTDFLEGSNSINNHLIIATSNNSAGISQKLLRPSRIDIQKVIDVPSESTRKEYFTNKNISEPLLSELVEASEDFTLAELKELFICTTIFGYSIEESIDKITSREMQDYMNQTTLGFVNQKSEN